MAQSKITAAQQRALDELRAEREARAAKTKATKAANAKTKRALGFTPTEEVVHAADVASNENEAFQRLTSAYEHWAESLGICSVRRYIGAAVLGILTAGGVGWMLGTVLGYLMVGVLAATGSMFLYYMTLVIGFILAIWAGSKIGNMVVDYIVTKKVDAHCAYIKGKVTGWFKSNAPVLSAA